VSPLQWLRAARLRLTSVLAVTGILSALLITGMAAPAQAAQPLPSSIGFEQWDRTSNTWVPGELNMVYNEGEVVPFRIDVTGIPAGQYQVSICRTFMNNQGTAFGYNFLAPYNTTVNPTIGNGATPTNTVGPVTGAAAGPGTATIDSVTEVGGQGACKLATQRETIVVFTITGTPTAAYVLFGGHLAAPTDEGVGVGHGASQVMGSSLHMELLTPAKALPINVGAQTTGLVTIIKTALPGSPDPFTFDPSTGINGTGNTFQLTSNGSPASVSFTVNPTSADNPLTVTETALPAGYSLASIVCTSTITPDASNGDLGTLTATFDVQPGEHVTCTFTDVVTGTPTGRLEVRKVLSPDTDMGRFNLLIDNMVFAPNVGNGGTTGSQLVSVGTHPVSELAAGMTNLANYTTTLQCVNAAGAVVVPPGGGTLSATAADVAVGPGDVITCTFTNTRGRGTLEVVKHLVPLTDAGRFDLFINGTLVRAAAGDGQGSGAVPVNAGINMVSELGSGLTNLADFTSSVLCTHVVNGVTVTVASGPVTSINVPVAIGDAVRCTITNIRRPSGGGGNGYGTDPKALPTERPYDPVPGGEPAGNTGQSGVTKDQPSSSPDPGAGVAGSTDVVTPVGAPADDSGAPAVEGAVEAVQTHHGDLPKTGASILQEAILGSILMGSGLVLLALRRRGSLSPSA